LQAIAILFFGGILMSGFIKVKAKELLLGNTLKLFLVFITSFVLKVTSIISIVLFQFIIHLKIVMNQ
jgi:hypothetical protein